MNITCNKCRATDFLFTDPNGQYSLCYATCLPLWRWCTVCEELCKIETFVLHHKNDFAIPLDESNKCIKHAYADMFAGKSKFDILFAYLVTNNGVPGDLLD